MNNVYTHRLFGCVCIHEHTHKRTNMYKFVGLYLNTNASFDAGSLHV
jgi:hypothetical protein